MSRPRFLAIACVAVLLGAVLWTALHLQWHSGSEVVVLAASAAGQRLDARMEMVFPSGAVAVNHATAEELCALHGVGMAQAKAILLELEANGAFVFPEDLLSVKGIGVKKLAGMVDDIRLD